MTPLHTAAGRVRPGLAFSASSLVGGADADLLVGTTLYELKTTMRPSLRHEWLYQLLDYVLLDTDDEYGIDAVGFYLSRQGLLIRWPLDELISRTACDSSVAMHDRRRDLAATLSRPRQPVRRD